MLLELHNDVRERIFEFICFNDLCNLSLCSRASNKMCRPNLWKNVRVHLPHLVHTSSRHLKNMKEQLQYVNSLTLFSDYYYTPYYMRNSPSLMRKLYRRKQNAKVVRKLLKYCDDLSLLNSCFLPVNIVQCLRHMDLQEVCLSGEAALDHLTIDKLCDVFPHLRSLAIQHEDYRDFCRSEQYSEQMGQSINKLKMLQKLKLRYSPISIQHISGIVSLRELELSRYWFLKDEYLHVLCSSLVNLNKLCVHHFITNENPPPYTFSSVSLLVSLREFHMYAMDNPDTAISSLRSCKELRVLKIYSEVLKAYSEDNFKYSLTDKGMAYISEMKKLHEVALVKSKRITSSGFARLAHLPNLTTLCLDENDNVDDDCVKAISTIDTLKYLSLRKCSRLTKVAVSHLSTMKMLDRLFIRGCFQFSDKMACHAMLAHVRWDDLT